MQPTLAQVVPLNESSMSTVEAPAPRATRSADRPAVPAPMIATSTLMRARVRNRRARGLQRKYSIFQGVGAAGGIRTPDPNVRSVVLYPTELRPRTCELHPTDAGGHPTGILGAAILPQRFWATRNPARGEARTTPSGAFRSAGRSGRSQSGPPPE